MKASRIFGGFEVVFRGLGPFFRQKSKKQVDIDGDFLQESKRTVSRSFEFTMRHSCDCSTRKNELANIF